MDSIRMGTRVYVGRLPYSARERDIERFFKGYGRVKEVLLKNGYGFVEFDDSRDADDAVYELNGKELLGERIILEHARGPSARRDRGGGDGGGFRDRDDYRGGGRGGGGGGGGFDRDGGKPRYNDKYGPPTRTDFRLVVENLSSRVSWQDLKDYMRQAGEVTYADAHKEEKNRGAIEFASYNDMINAKDKLDGTEINGRKIRLVEDKPRTGGSSRRSRSRSPSRGRRSYSKSRSRSRSARRSRSRSRSRSASKSRSRSRSGKSRSPSKSRSRSRSRSRD